MLKKHAWLITAFLSVTYFIGAIFEGSDWLLAGVFFGVVTAVLWFLKKRKETQKSTARVIEKTETFHLRGINHNGRQEHVKNLKAGQGLTPRFYRFESEPAIELSTFEGNSVGFVPKELAPRFTSEEYVFMVERVYDFGDGRKGAEIRVLM